MGKDQTSVMVLQIRVKFWCMIPMGVKYSHTKFEQESQRWRPGTGFASGGPQFQKLQFRAKNSHFWAKKKPWNTFKTAKRRETVGTLNTCGLTSPCQRALCGPVRIFPNLILHNGCPANGPKRPPEAPNADSHKPRIGHIFG